MPRARPNRPIPRSSARASAPPRRRYDPNRPLFAIRRGMYEVYARLQAAGGGAESHLYDWACDNPDQFYRLMVLLRPLPAPPEAEAPHRVTRIALVAPGIDPARAPPASTPSDFDAAIDADEDPQP